MSNKKPKNTNTSVVKKNKTQTPNSQVILNCAYLFDKEAITRWTQDKDVMFAEARTEPNGYAVLQLVIKPFRYNDE